MRRLALSLVPVLASILTAAASILPASAQTAPHLYRQPSLSDTLIAFRYADDIWTVPREGGVARRVTSSANVTEGPFFSPDGRTIAYTANAQGNTDIYTIPTTGGVPRRMTFRAGGNFALGWTPDGKDILMASPANSYRMFFRMYKLHADGSGLPEILPMPYAIDGSFSPDETHIAYNPILQWQTDSFKRYRGGQTQPVWIIDTKSLDVVKVPRDNSNDSNPVWLGDSVYFLSDRNGPISLFKYNTGSKVVTELVKNPHGLDMKTLNGHGNALVYEQFGTIHLFDTSSNSDKVVSIQADGDLPALAPHMATISPNEIHNVGISPTGVRAVFEAHGEIFTVPAEKGDTRNLTRTSNAAERDPAWSPDGKSIAYFSDASGEYKLYIRDQDGMKAPKIIDLGPSPTYYYAPVWSPDSKRVLFTDKRTNLLYVNVDGTSKPVIVDHALRADFGASAFSASFSPDGKWILYVRDLMSLEHAAFLYNIATGKSTQITDGMSDVNNTAFDAGGKYIYFTASTDNGPAIDGFGLSSFNRTATASAYIVVLDKDGLSPIPPESDDEKSKDADADKKPAPTDAAASEEKKDAAKKEDTKKDDKDKKDDKSKLPDVKIDLDGIQQRILALPIPARNYVTLLPLKTGVILLGEGNPAPNSSVDPQTIRTLYRFTLESRKTEDVMSGIDGIVVSFDGKKILYDKGPAFFIVGADELKPGGGGAGKPLNLRSMTAEIDPRAEFQQMYNESWRIEREFFYDTGYHGLDLHKIAAKYQPYVAGLSSRSDLTYLQNEMLGELTIGHMFIRGPRSGGDGPHNGLLGADFVIDHNLYRIQHIVQGGNWNPKLYSPLTQPGVNVKEGDYILAINGTPLHATENLYAALEGTANKQVTLTVSHNAAGTDPRDVVVVPVASETTARMQEWIEHNIAETNRLSNGQIAYVYLPDTGGSGFNSFNRYFFAQVDKKAVIVDDRWNQGGDIADWVIEVLKRTPMINYEAPQGLATTEPTGAIFGPKAMLINQNAGSGGDAMPWLFRQAKLGPLVGTKTWGGLVGIGGYPVLIDGGSITAPRTALYNLQGEFDIENKGVPPDVEVEDDPKSIAAGHDPQLEKAISILLEDLKKNPPPTYAKPPYPNYHKNDGLGH